MRFSIINSFGISFTKLMSCPVIVSRLTTRHAAWENRKIVGTSSHHMIFYSLSVGAYSMYRFSSNDPYLFNNFHCDISWEKFKEIGTTSSDDTVMSVL